MSSSSGILGPVSLILSQWLFTESTVPPVPTPIVHEIVQKSISFSENTLVLHSTALLLSTGQSLVDYSTELTINRVLTIWQYTNNCNPLMLCIDPHTLEQGSAMQYSAVQCSAVSVWFSGSAVQCSTMQCSAV